MPTTTTDYGKQNISWPDLGYEAGAGLQSAITGSIAVLSDQINSKWSGSVTIPAAGVVQLAHNFNMAATELIVRFVESGAELLEGADTDFAVAEVDVNTISVTNNDAVSRTVEFYVFPKLSLRGTDIDPGTNIVITGNITAQDVTVNGDLTVNGTTTTVNSATLEVADANILVNNGGTDATAEGAGLTVEGTGDAELGKIIYEGAAVSKFKVGATGSEKEIATIDDAQVITNKDIDGGTASNTNRISVPKGADFATLDALTRNQGGIVYNQDKNEFLGDNGTDLVAIGGGGGLVPSAAIDDTFVGTIEKDQEYIVDISAGNLSVVLPTALADENYKIAFNIQQITEGNKLNVATGGGQQIYFNGVADTDMDINELVRVEFAWNGTDWTAKVPWYPTYSNLPKASASEYGVVKQNKVGTIILITGESSSVTDISTNGNPANSDFKFTGLTVGDWYTLNLTAFLQIDANAAATNYVTLKAIHNSDTIATRGVRNDTSDDTSNTNASTQITFKAAATDVTFDVDIPNSGSVRGNGTIAETCAQLFTRHDLDSVDRGSDLST